MNRRTGAWLGVLTAIPIAAALFFALAWSAGVPEPEDWRRLAGRESLCFEWRDVTSIAEVPKLIVFRVVYTWLLSLPGSDFGRFAFLGWSLALITWWIVRRLTITPGRNAGPWTACASFVLALVAFSPGFGANWLLGARFQVFVPALTVVGGAALLCGSGRWRLRFISALVLSTLAIFTDPRGPLVWIALAPLVWSAARAAERRAGAALAVWVLVASVATIVCHDDLTTAASTAAGLAGHATTSPKAMAAYALRSAGHSLPLGGLGAHTAILWVGGSLLAAWLALGVTITVRRRHADRVRATAWWALAFFGAASPLLVIGEAFPPRAPESWMRELSWGAWLLPFGVVFGFRTIAPRVTAIPAGAFLVAIAIASIADFDAATIHFGRQRALLGHGTAMHVFYAALGDPGLTPHVRPPIPGIQRAKHLRDRGRLRSAAPESADIAELTVAFDGPSPGRLLAATTIGAHGDVHPGRFQRGPDAILLARRRGPHEMIVRLTRPNYLHVGETLPWLAPVPPMAFEVDDELCAYAYDVGTRTARPLDGVWRFDGGAFVEVNQGGR